MTFRKRCAPRFHAECTCHCVESFHEEPIREKNVIFKIQGPKSRVQNPDRCIFQLPVGFTGGQPEAINLITLPDVCGINKVISKRLTVL